MDTRIRYCKRCANFIGEFGDDHYDKCPRCGYPGGGYVPDELARVWMIAKYKKECEEFLDEHVRSQPEYDKEMDEKVQQMVREQVEEDRRNYRPTFAYNGVSCPYCHSSNTKKLSGFGVGFSAGLLGLGSSKIGKQWHCKSCGSNF